MILDTHQHFWHYDPVRHEWISDEMKAIRKDFLPEQLQAIYQKTGVDGCIAVQVDQTEAETHFLLDLADKHDFIKGVVGWVDLQDENIEERLAYFSRFDKLVGFRHIVQGEADVNFMLRPGFLNGISHLSTYHFTYDILIFPHQLGAALELIRQFPDQKFVIDHLAKPYIKDQFFDGWAVMMKAIGKYPNAYCKVSGMITEADWSNWKQHDFIPYLDLVYEAFGPDRLMFGSDWPVCLLAGEYDEVLNLVHTWMAALSETEKEKILGQNALGFYGIK
ncbi:MAG: amidohydrolase family protein [Bacteroidetes bacterium]|nr:amidohydrolase family protein [Bacteroidota bacterium]MCB0844791.1 amidohydrolase family protein [Bacteroidota bacterium]